MKHDQLAQALRLQILTGEMVAADGRLPGERALAAQFGVSRATVRRAAETLCREGLLLQVQGKGTFVKNFQDSKRAQSLYSVTRCAQNYAEQGWEPRVTVLSQQLEPAGERVAACLGLAPGARVLRLEKLYGAGRAVLNLSVSYLSPAEFPGVERLDFSQPICEVLRRRYGAQPCKTENTIEAVLPPPEVAAHLRISATTPILLFESLTTGLRDGRTVPLEYYRTYHRTDQFRFRFTQAEGPGQAGPAVRQQDAKL